MPFDRSYLLALQAARQRGLMAGVPASMAQVGGEPDFEQYNPWEQAVPVDDGLEGMQSWLPEAAQYPMRPMPPPQEPPEQVDPRPNINFGAGQGQFDFEDQPLYQPKVQQLSPAALYSKGRLEKSLFGDPEGLRQQQMMTDKMLGSTRQGQALLESRAELARQQAAVSAAQNQVATQPLDRQAAVDIGRNTGVPVPYMAATGRAVRR